MTKRYREILETVAVAPDGGKEPVGFEWRGRGYRVHRVLGHWREDPGWWRRPNGQQIQIEQSDLWRVEAQNGHGGAGVYELVHRDGTWVLDRVWD